MCCPLGLLASILSIIALISIWGKEGSNGLQWLLIILFIANLILKGTLRESLRLYGMHDNASKFWGIICVIVQLSLIMISIYVFVK